MLTRQKISDDILMNFLMAPRYRIYRHLILIFFVMMISINLAHFTFYEDNVFFRRAILLESAGSLMLFLAAIYLNIYVLIPRLMLKKKYGLYGLALFLVVSVLLSTAFLYDYYTYKSYGVEFGQYSYFYKNRFFPLEIVSNFLLFLICCIGPSMITLLRHWLDYGQRASKLKKEKLHSELERLKNQVSPQFLLNMLSKATELAVVDPRQTSAILVQLGKLLRYQLYDSSREKVFLSADLSFLENFLNLEKMLNPMLRFTITKEGLVNYLLVPPLLFIPFVEYFIYQSERIEKEYYIHMSFRVEKGELIFSCASSVWHHDVSKLDNIRRRLELLYETYSLEEVQGDTENRINMHLTLSR